MAGWQTQDWRLGHIEMNINFLRAIFLCAELHEEN